MRLFVAINLPPEVRRSIWVAAAPLRDRAYPIRWVDGEAIHLTLKFLGAVAEEREGAIRDAVNSAVAGTKTFLLPIGGFGAFPTPSRPQVVWIGCDPVPPLELLQHRIERQMDELGFPLEGRPFRPHFTLGRVKRGARPSALRGLEALLDQLGYVTEVTVQSVDLMQSELTSAGARYTTRHAASLLG